MMLRTTVSTIRKVCPLGFVRRVLGDDICNGPASYAVIRKTHKSTKSTDDGPGQTEHGTDLPALKTTSPDPTTGIPLTHREKCQKIIDASFGASPVEPVKEQYCSHTVNIEATRREMKEAESERKKIQELNLKLENPLIDDRRYGIFKMSRELIKTDDDLDEIVVEENKTQKAPPTDTVTKEETAPQALEEPHIETDDFKIQVATKEETAPRTLEEPHLETDVTKEETAPRTLEEPHLETEDFKIQVANASFIRPTLDYAEDDSDTVGNKADLCDDADAETLSTVDRVKNVTNPAEKPYHKRVLNVTTANEQDEKLAQKLETIEETPLVEAQKPGIEGFNVNPKVLGDQLNPKLSCNRIHKKQSHSEEGNLPGTYDEVAKRCLSHPLGQIDEMLVKEMESMGLPLTCNSENITPSTLKEDEQLVRMDRCNETNQQEHQEKTLFKSKVIEPGKIENSGPKHPNPDQIKNKIKPVCDNNPTTMLSYFRTALDGDKEEMEVDQHISPSQLNISQIRQKDMNQTIHKHEQPQFDYSQLNIQLPAPTVIKPTDKESMQGLHSSIFNQLTGRYDKNDVNTEAENKTHHTAEANKHPTNLSSMEKQAVLDGRDAANILVEREPFTKITLPVQKFDTKIENSPNKDNPIKPCSNKLHCDVHSENLEPEKVSLPEELMKEHELDPYYVLTCNETCPISPGSCLSACENTDFVDTTDTIYMKKNVCESILPKTKPNMILPFENMMAVRPKADVKSLMSQYENLTSDTKSQINHKINVRESVKPKLDLKHLVTPQCESVHADTQAQLHKISEIDFKLMPENTTEITDLTSIKPKVSPEDPSLPSSQPETLTELLKRVRERSRMQCTSDLGVQVDPITGKCPRKSPRCAPTGPRSPPSDPIPPPRFGLPMVKRRPKICKPKRKGGGSKMCAACDIDVTCGVQLGGICSEIACELDKDEACNALSRVDLTEVILDQIQTLGKMVSVVLRQIKTNVDTLLARDYDPWAPIPSWPLPKKVGNPCDKPCGNWKPGISGAPPCVRGCPVFPKASASTNPAPPCNLKPCKGFPKRRSFSALDCFAVTLEDNELYDLGQF